MSTLEWKWEKIEVGKKSFMEIELTPDDLGYESKYNHSTLRGYISYLGERAAEFLPGSARRLIKATIPKPVMRSIFPHRSNRED